MSGAIHLRMHKLVQSAILAIPSNILKLLIVHPMCAPIAAMHCHLACSGIICFESNSQQARNIAALLDCCGQSCADSPHRHGMGLYMAVHAGSVLAVAKLQS
jgi:hypothetical protein